MPVLESLKDINDVIKNIALFVQTDEFVKPDFEEYIKTIGTSNGTNFNSACFNYMFERNLGNEYKSILQLYLERNNNISSAYKKIVKSLMKSISSVFEIKKVTKNGFEMNNLINEKDYSVISLVKMTSFRGIGSGQYVVARIFEYEKNYCLIEISGVLPTSKKDDALRYSVAKIIQNPELVYLDNPKKQKELEKEVDRISKKFIEYFSTDEVITLNKYADDLIGMFNDYTETGDKQDFHEKIELPEIYNFFEVNEFNNSYENFLENSLGGFSSHKETYDVGIVFDKETGLYALPFYGTFNKIFETENLSEIGNYENCIKYYLENDKFSANIIKRVASKYNNFMERVNSVLNTSYTLDELLQKYKSRYLENKIFSPTTVLYKSKAFSKTLGIIEEESERPQLPENIDFTKIGRNDPCPCGSGKKFKKCCGAR